MTRKIWLMSIVAAATSCAAAHAEPRYASLQGVWVENFTECIWPSGHSPFTEHKLDVATDDGTKLVYADVITRNDGQKSRMTWVGVYDGQDHNWSNGYAMAYAHLEPNMYRDHWTAPDGRIGGDTCVISNGGKKLTCYGYMQPAGGKWVEMKEVFD